MKRTVTLLQNPDHPPPRVPCKAPVLPPYKHKKMTERYKVGEASGMFLLLKTEYHSRGRGGGGHRSPILETKAVGICKQNYPDLPAAVSNSFFFRTGKRGNSLTKYRWVFRWVGNLEQHSIIHQHNAKGQAGSLRQRLTLCLKEEKIILSTFYLFPEVVFFCNEMNKACRCVYPVIPQTPHSFLLTIQNTTEGSCCF